MSGNSNVGNSGVYEAGDQRNAPKNEDHSERFHEGNTHAHVSTDSSTFHYFARFPPPYVVINWGDGDGPSHNFQTGNRADSGILLQRTSAASPTAWPPRRRRSRS